MTPRERHVLETIRAAYGEFIEAAASAHRHRPEVLAGIMARESEGGLSPLLDQQGPAGRGDRGHGHGLMQIDDRSFPDFCNGRSWADPAANIDMGAWVLARKRRYLASRALGYAVTNDALERAAIAAYNAGEGAVLRCVVKSIDPDTATTGRNYSSEVLRLATAYLEISTT